MIKTYPESRYQLTDPSVIRQYLYAGKGIVTLESPSGKSHTYLFQKPKDESTFPEDVRFVYAVHDNEKLFYIGMIEDGSFRLTRHSRFLPDNEIVKGARYIWDMAHHRKDGRMKLYHEGVCGRCGRQLTQHKVLETGIGRKCQGIINDNKFSYMG